AVVTQNVTTFEVHSNIDDDRKQHLLSGMNVSARFVSGKLEDALLVPTVCIISKHGKTGVLIPQPDGNPQFKAVKTGPSQGAKTAISRGLKEGDLVFLGLTKSQLEEQGYGGDPNAGGKGGRDGGSKSAPIPRSFSR
ncbi:MAG: hypothetical protein K2X27_08760, partial [Candidatus Obscuribacterales bacterium]|nr:hypothetical protein [Candidatus Obscuribacterales bacterium]